MADKYDIAIIGSGLGGLVCGNILAREGFRVCVLEKEPVLGGCLQTYYRRRYAIDAGFHYVGCLDEGQILNRYFRFLGLMNKLKIRRLDTDGFDVINIDGREFRHAIGHENFIDTLSRDFPEERANIRKIIEKIREIGDLIGADALSKKGGFATEVLPYFHHSAADFIRENTDNILLQKVLTGSSMLCGGEQETSLAVFSMVFNSNIESSYRFVDGSQQVIDLLADNIRQNGGEVRNNSEVVKLNVDNEKVTSAELADGQLIESRYFISNIHPVLTFNILGKTSLVKKSYVSRLNSLKNSGGFFTLSLMLKTDAFPYLNRNFYYHKGDKKVFFCTSADSGSEQFAKTAQILEPMNWSEVAQWENTKVGRRGADYLEFKKQRAEKLLEFVSEFQPKLKDTVAFTSTSTPLTFRDYTGTIHGSAYGIVKDYRNPLLCLVPCKTKLPNLFLTGQNNNIHGMLGVFQTALYTCSELLGQEYLVKKIIDT
ncbi:MAG: NAD(P)/FAD-dependent oxidoreductase [Dysgonamonadaceae bacterium]|jgi:phytoene dehydrogenase-like protein|nr:NAD(P)/FAD-dependent oxidoreductase [Dysgonamonadaceae bacterium]